MAYRNLEKQALRKRIKLLSDHRKAAVELPRRIVFEVDLWRQRHQVCLYIPGEVDLYKQQVGSRTTFPFYVNWNRG